MYQVEGTTTDQGIVCKLSGRIDSTNAAKVEEEFNACIAGNE